MEEYRSPPRKASKPIFDTDGICYNILRERLSSIKINKILQKINLFFEQGQSLKQIYPDDAKRLQVDLGTACFGNRIILGNL